uniref:Uncharacterized protein n=1 Tax=Panagrolaimus sp. PS1159 TaxID=55785 RepID=A0AC35EVI3_9BILA
MDNLYLLPIPTSEDIITNAKSSFSSLKTPITTYIDDLQNLATKKIGPILDYYTTKFPPGVTDTLTNLTYEELDALKMIAAAVPYLKQLLCDSEEDQRIAQNIKSVTRYLFLPESPQLPEKIKNSFKTFTPEIPIFAISPSKELTNIYLPSVTLWTLQNCRSMADQNIMARSAICEGPGLLFV